MKKFQPIGISGAGFSGKDSLALTLKKILLKYNIEVIRYGCADELKILADPFLRKVFGISAFTTNKEEKSLIRPILVEIGRIKRIQTKGTFWTDFLTPKVKDCIDNEKLCIISDIRYDDINYPNDECDWLKNKFNGILVFIERVLPNGQLVPDANKEEERFNKLLKEKSDYKLRWQTTLDESIWEETVSVQLKDLISKIVNN